MQRPRIRSKLLLAPALFVGCLLGYGADPHGAQGAEPSSVDACGEPRAYVLTIGIDQYRNHPRLKNAEADADRVAQLMHEHFHFRVLEPLRGDQVTVEAIEASLVRISRSLRGRRACTQDRLLVYYAGHGHHGHGNRPEPELILASDPPPGHPDATTKPEPFTRSRYSVPVLLHHLDRLPVGHVTVVLDACDMGLALGNALRTIEPLDDPAKTPDVRQSRKLLAAAGHLQYAFDGGPAADTRTSPLVEALLHGLKAGDADLYADGHVTFSELGIYLQAEVSRATRGVQVPEFGAFGSDGRGEPVIAQLGAQDAETIDESSLQEADHLEARVRRAVNAGRLAVAARNLDRLLQIRDAIGRRIRALTFQGYLAEQRGEWSAATQAFTEALELRERLFPRGHPAVAGLTQRISALMQRTDPSNTEEWEQRTIEAWRQATGQRFGEFGLAASLNTAASWAWQVGQHNVALALLDTAGNVPSSVDAPLDRAQVEVNRGVVLAAAGKKEEAIVAVNEGVSIARTVPRGTEGRTERLADMLTGLHQVQLAAGHVKEALQTARVLDRVRNNTPTLHLEGSISTPRLLADRPQANVQNPRWSPDGLQLAIEVETPYKSEEWIINLEDGLQSEVTTGNRAQMTTFDGEKRPIVDLTWAPDMKLLSPPWLFSSRGPKRNFDLFADGSWLTSNDGSDRQPAWSSDARYIAYLSQRRESTDIFAMDLGGDPEKPFRITHFDSAIDFAPSWSPRNSRLLFSQQNRTGTTGFGIVVDVRRPEATTQIVVDWTGSSVRPSWSPDARRIAFYSNKGAREADDYRLWVIDISGRNARRLAGPVVVHQPTNIQAARRSRPVWSPDGDYLFFVRRDKSRRNPITWVDIETGRTGVFETDTLENDDLALTFVDHEWRLAFSARGRIGEIEPSKFRQVYMITGTLDWP